MARLDPQLLIQVLEKARVATDQCPCGAVTGAAGLALIGCELPRDLEREAVDGPVRLSADWASDRRSPVAVRRHRDPLPPWLTLDGVPIASPADCLVELVASHLPADYCVPFAARRPWADLSVTGQRRRLRRILELDGQPWPLTRFTRSPDREFLNLIMVADGLMRRKNPIMSKQELERGLDALGRRPGIRGAQLVVSLAEPGTDSVPETWVRVVMRDAGLPRGIPNRPVRDESGVVVRSDDLGVEGYPMAVEYQGGYHFKDAEQAYLDMERREQLRSLGRTMIEVGYKDLPDQTRLIRRIATEIALFEGWRLPKAPS
ncbi:MAG: hypothetical protein LBK95_14600 [Bifidobacteriaceae bacterium]|nr:hypothetical protein [Bifidobacteriaceae bacterium]